VKRLGVHKKVDELSHKKIVWQDRVVGLERLPSSSLHTHPLNWREHSALQQEALSGVLREVGIAGALLVYRNDVGEYVTIDGHLRKSLDPDQLWPCLVLDVDDTEAALLLATHDPLAAMAEANTEALTRLLHEVQSGEAAVQAMLSELAVQEGIVPPEPAQAPDDFPSYDDAIETEHTCPKCGYQWSGGQ
jgi:hypothetical protein